jgi:hypothetical protein
VSNANCPADFPYCNCNNRLFTDFTLNPGSVEYTDKQLAQLLNSTKECDLIRQKLGYSWFGIDYSEPHSPYNCICFNSGSGTSNNDYKDIPPLTDNWKKYVEIKPEEEENNVDVDGEPPPPPDCPKDPETGEDLGACCSTLDGCFQSTSARCTQRISWTRCKTCQEVNCNPSGLLPLSAETNQTGSSNQSNQTGSSNQLTSKIVRYTNTTSASNDENLLFFNYDQRKIFGESSAFPLPVSEIPNPEDDKVCPGPIIGPNFKFYKEYSKTNATFWNTPPETPLFRRAQTALMNAQRVKILVHGNINITPGTIVNIDYFNFGGRWMVYRVERTITAERHSMYLYLMRDGTF